MDNNITIGRRCFLRATGATAVLGGAGALAACGSTKAPADSSSPSANVPESSTPGGGASTSKAPATDPSGPGRSVLPTYTPQEVVKLDYPATDTGAPGAVSAYPASPPQISQTAPANGGTITFFNTTVALPTPVGKNQFWQELNKRLHAELKISFTPSSGYQRKFATSVAGNDLQDLMLIQTDQIPHVEDVLKAKFQDLSPWLSGDAVKDYPNLAALPTISWRSMVFNGGIYGIPYVVPVISGVPQVRQDLFNAMGVGTPDLADGQDFLSLCKELTDSRKQRWAFGDLASAQTIVRQMTGTPNVWSVDAGKFTSAYTTDAYKQAIDIVAGMRRSGYFQPDVATGTSSARALFIAGKVSIAVTGYISWSVWATQGILSEPKFEIGGLVLPQWDGGGQSAYHEGAGASRMTSLKKADSSRIEELLRVADWAATPFGSEEYLFLRYGIAERDYTLQGTDPISTDTGVSEVRNMYMQNLSRPVIPIYNPGPGQEKAAQTEYEYLVAVMKESTPLPTVGLVSDTDLSKGAAINKTIGQLESDIILGHKPLSAWDGGVKAWLANGGATIGHEYEEAYAKSHAE